MKTKEEGRSSANRTACLLPVPAPEKGVGFPGIAAKGGSVYRGLGVWKSAQSHSVHCGTLSSLPLLVGIRWRHFVTEGAVRLFRGLWDPAVVWRWRPEGTSSRPSWLVGQRVRVRPAASSTVRSVFSFGMRLACPPATAGSQRTCASFLADLSASLLDLLGTLWRATEVGTTVEKIDRETAPRAEFMALVVLTENVKNASLYHYRVDAQLPPHLRSKNRKSEARNRRKLVESRNSHDELPV